MAPPDDDEPGKITSTVPVGENGEGAPDPKVKGKPIRPSTEPELEPTEDMPIPAELLGGGNA